ncbi:hypothetical protein UlMin_010570 [Ulmus minor]
MATISQVLGKKYNNQNSSSKFRRETQGQIHMLMINFHVRNKLKFKESHIALSKSQKRASPYCCSQADANAGSTQKFRVVENEGKCHRVIGSNLSILAKQVNIALPRDNFGEKGLHSSFNIRTTRFPDNIGGSYAVNFESEDYTDSLASSVCSCTVSSNNSCSSPCHVSASPIDNLDNNSSDSESSEIHGLALHAYCCTIEALYVSSSLSWEQQEFITNLCLSLQISNDKHLLEIRNLVSADTSTQFR